MNIPTIEELDKTGCEAAGYAAGYTTITDYNTLQCRYITAIRDAVVAACRPQLRPIEEMPEQVPDGCVRICARRYFEDKRWIASSTRYPEDTHFIDITIPSPAYPADFEAAFAESKLDAKDKEAAFTLWKGGVR